ncbi:hypothetical protein NFI96_023761, partial [Prochilodus magdalenae]
MTHGGHHYWLDVCSGGCWVSQLSTPAHVLAVPELNGSLDLFVVARIQTVSGVSIIGPEDVLIEGESSANLTCVGSDPIDTVEWRKDDQVLNSSDRIEFSENKTSVLISSVLRTDSGEYSCILNNNNSEAANYTLTVNYGPDVRILGEGNVEEGSVILLFCSVMSVPAASVTWTVGGSTVGNSPLLFIENSTNTHSGEYTCTAYNSVTGNTVSEVLSLLVTGETGTIHPSITH